MYLNKFLSAKLVAFFLAIAVPFASFAQEESKQNAVLVLGDPRTRIDCVANMIINNNSDECKTPLPEDGLWRDLAKATRSKRDGLSVISTHAMPGVTGEKYGYDRYRDSIVSLQSSFNITSVVVIVCARPRIAMFNGLLQELNLTEVPVLVLSSEGSQAEYSSEWSRVALRISKHAFVGVFGWPNCHESNREARAAILATINEMLDKSAAPVPLAVLPELNVKADVACQMTLLPWQTAVLQALAQINAPVRDSLVTELASRDAAQVEALIAQLIATMKGA